MPEPTVNESELEVAPESTATPFTVAVARIEDRIGVTEPDNTEWGTVAVYAIAVSAVKRPPEKLRPERFASSLGAARFTSIAYNNVLPASASTMTDTAVTPMARAMMVEVAPEATIIPCTVILLTLALATFGTNVTDVT